MIRRASLIFAILLSAAACGRGGGAAGEIPRETFIAANVELRALPDTATPERRAAVLRRHGVTERQLKAWVAANAREPEVLAKAWTEIAFRLDSLGGAPPGEPKPVPTAAPLPAPPAEMIEIPSPEVRPQPPVEGLDTLRGLRPPVRPIGEPPPPRRQHRVQ